MITIEASNIYFRGGLVLLEQILDYCEQNSLSAKVYIGYQDVFDYLTIKNYSTISLEKTTNLKTLIRYFKSSSNTLFFCNLPPFVKSKQSILYAHNALFFESPYPSKDFSFVFNVKKVFYFFWIKIFTKNVEIVGCQTAAVQGMLFQNLNINASLFPFYHSPNRLELEKKYQFCYIASGASHKNNARLLEAIERLSDKYIFTVVMTIEDNGNYQDLIEKIKQINSKNEREIIINRGLLPYEEVIKVYSESEALIFPSLKETIALPLIEGMQHELKILSSDLDFTYQVVENPIVFNPESVDEIQKVMENYLNGKYDHVIQRNKIPNKLPELIQQLSA